jgi:hypothetical protein
VPRVRMVWSTRSASLVGAVADMLQLPVSYRSLVRSPSVREKVASAVAAVSSSSCVCTSLEVECGCVHAAGDAYVCDIYATCPGELEKLVSGMCGAAEPRVRGGVFREGGEMDGEGAVAAAGAARVRGGRVRLHGGRPDVGREITATLTNPATGTVTGDVTRKLVLVCGPEGLVADAVNACARLGVAVHTEKFLF